MPSSYAGTRLAFISPSAPQPGTVLSITSGNVTLSKRFASLVTVQDDLGNAVTGCTLNIADPSKCTANGMRLIGAGTSGTTTVTASKAGYATSAAITMTAAANILLMDLTSAAGTSTTTNAASVPSWVDQGTVGATFSEATNPPTYLSVGITGGPAVLFNGTNQLLTSSSVAGYNIAAGNNCCEGAVFRTTSDGGTDRFISSHYDSASFHGVQLVAQSSDIARVGYGTGGQLTNLNDATAEIKAAAAVTMMCDLYGVAGAGTPQQLYVNGVAVGTPNTTLNFRDNSAAVVHRLGVNFAGTSNWAPIELYWRWKSSRILTTLERAQMVLAMDIVRGL